MSRGLRANKGEKDETEERMATASSCCVGKSKHEGQGDGKTGSFLARMHSARHELNIRCSRSKRQRLRASAEKRRVGREMKGGVKRRLGEIGVIEGKRRRRKTEEECGIYALRTLRT